MSTPTSRGLYVNLPVADLPASRAYHGALGFTFNEQFSDETAACLVISEMAGVMLLTHAKFAQFSDRPRPDARATTGVLLAIALADRAEVDRVAETALARGGTAVRAAEDLGFMYTRAIADLDGHIFEYFFMDTSAFSAG